MIRNVHKWITTIAQKLSVQFVHAAMKPAALQQREDYDFK